MNLTLPRTLASGTWLCAALLAFARPGLAGDPLSSLAPRGAVQATDQLPILPANAPALQSTTAGAILGYVRNYPQGIVCDGVHDDTAAIQTAISAGSSFDLPPGVCVTKATLVVSSVASHGQTIRGSGETAADGSGSGKTVVRPAAGVSTAVLIDGTPFGGYLQGFSIEGLSLDMANMPPGARGFSQLQAYDIRYAKIRVTHDAGKTSWNLGPGAYTTSLNDVQGSLVYCLGNGVNNPTTISLVNPDIGGLNIEQCANVTTVGGSIQPAYTGSNTIVWLPAGTSPEGFGPNPNGMYVALGSYMLNAQFISTIGTDWEALSQPPTTCLVTGWSYGTYNDGAHGCHPVVMGIQINGGVANVSLLNSTFGGMYAYNSGGQGDNLTLTGYQTGGGQGNYHDGSETFNSSIYVNNSQALFGYSGGREANGVNTFLLDASTGSANFTGGVSVGSLKSSSSIAGKGLSVIPATSGINFATIGQFGCFNGATPSTSSCFMGSGSKFVGLQDPAGAVQTFNLDASVGSASFTGLITGGSITAAGPLSANTLSVLPHTVGNFAAIDQFGCYHAATASASSCFIGAGSKLVGLQDAAGTVTDISLDASTGRITSGSGMCPGAGTDANPTLTGGTCFISGGGNPTISLGLNGWFYLRSDCTHGLTNCLWHKEGGVWFSLN